MVGWDGAEAISAIETTWMVVSYLKQSNKKQYKSPQHTIVSLSTYIGSSGSTHHTESDIKNWNNIDWSCLVFDLVFEVIAFSLRELCETELPSMEGPH